MQLSIHKRDLQWSDALARHTERRVHHNLRRWRERVQSVFVRLADVNGPRGGEDKHCAVSVRLSTGREIVVTSREACPYRAVDDAVSRVKRSIGRHLTRRRRLQRRG